MRVRSPGFGIRGRQKIKHKKLGSLRRCRINCETSEIVVSGQTPEIEIL
jgi:hypothetical protein